MPLLILLSTTNFKRIVILFLSCGILFFYFKLHLYSCCSCILGLKEKEIPRYMFHWIQRSQHLNFYRILSFEQQLNHNSIEFLPQKFLLVGSRDCIRRYFLQFLQINVKVFRLTASLIVFGYWKWRNTHVRRLIRWDPVWFVNSQN